jgi:predicted alpha/beta-fold hydrolase
MENVRVPLLVLHAANDPLATAQSIADLFARVQNPNVGVILLAQGGHMGFSALSADYYYSVLLNFFDPAAAPAPMPPNP